MRYFCSSVNSNQQQCLGQLSRSTGVTLGSIKQGFNTWGKDMYAAMRVLAIQRQLFEGNYQSRRLQNLFSIYAEERLDKKEIILFATFDPPDPPVPGNIGHFCVVGVNLKLKRFELLDSLRGSDDPDAHKVFHKMVHGIKKLWKQAGNSKGESFTPKSVDHFTMEYVSVPKQGTAHDCGFFMLQILQSWDGESLVIFKQADILNIRMTLLYSWLTTGDFNIDLQAVLGVDGGTPLGLEEDNFTLFETQFCTPEVHVIPEIDYLNQTSKAKKALSRLFPAEKKTGKKGARASDVEIAVLLSDDEDDFVSPVPPKTRSKPAKKQVEIISTTSSDDFVTQQARRQPSGGSVLSNKRATKVPKKMRVPVPKLVPYTFPLLSKASQIKSLVLSKEYLDEFGDVPLCKFTSPVGESSVINGNFMFRLFGRCEMLEADIIDLIISYWKGSPDMKHLFDSGDRVLLGPYVITYMLDVPPFPPVDSKGNPIERSPFDVKEAAKMFSHYVRECENLLTANLVLIPNFKSSHYTIYGLNRITGTFDIFDTRRYSGFHITRGQHHAERVEVARRLVALMKEVYGEQEYNKKNQFDWVALAEKCNYVQTPEQGANECAFYILKLATIFDGEKFVEKIKPKDRRVEDWKSEYMYQVMYHPTNELSPADWPSTLRDLALLLGIASQSTADATSDSSQARGLQN